MTSAIIVGYGNLGKAAERIMASVPDVNLDCIVTRRPEVVRSQIDSDVPVISVEEALRLTAVGEKVAILCGNSKDLWELAPKFASKFNTVCSFDDHPNIGSYQERVDQAARKAGKTAIVCAGWDPGFFSIMRVLFSAISTGCQAKVYTFWGPGISQGHSSEARKVEGVKDARSYTLPRQEVIADIKRGELPDLAPHDMHKRLVYVVQETGADCGSVRKKITSMPNYYAPYETEVVFISEKEMEEKHSSLPHGGFVLCSFSAENGKRQLIEFKLNLESNPDFTARTLIACARAAEKMRCKRRIGAFPMISALEYLSPDSWPTLLAKNLI